MCVGVEVEPVVEEADRGAAAAAVVVALPLPFAAGAAADGAAAAVCAIDCAAARLRPGIPCFAAGLMIVVPSSMRTRT